MPEDLHNDEKQYVQEKISRQTGMIDRIIAGRPENAATAVVELLDPQLTLRLPANLLPHDADEGDAVKIRIEISDEITKRRKKKIQELQDRLIKGS